MVVLVSGSLCNGFSFVGPFPSETLAMEWSGKHRYTDDSAQHVVYKIETPDEVDRRLQLIKENRIRREAQK